METVHRRRAHRETAMSTPQYDPDAVERAERAVFEEQESNARSTAGTSPRDDEQADELAEEAEDLEDEE
jgi:hypothetical protein